MIASSLPLIDLSEKEEGELLPIEDPLMDDNTLLNDFLDSEVNQFGVEAVEDFMIKAFGKKKELIYLKSSWMRWMM